MNKLKTLFLSILIGSFAGAIASFAFSSPGSNQPPNGGPTFWLLNSTNMYYQGGSVGIGTSTPRNILNISNTTAGSNIFFDIDASTSSNAGMRTYSGGSQINFFGKSAGYNNATVVDANGGYLILNPSGTNVGIGTASPAAKMDVAGGIKMANDTDVCNASKAGTIRWTGTSFQGCTGAAWGNFLSPSDGTTQARAGRTCKTLLDNGYSTGSGAYWIDPDNDGDTSNAFQIYCDMAKQG